MSTAQERRGGRDLVTRVLVVDDHRTFTELLELALSVEADLEFVGAAHTAADALRQARARRPDVVVLDVQLGEDDGLEVCALLTRDDPDLRVVVLTAQTSGSLLQRAAQGGASALLPKDGSLDELLRAVRGPTEGFVVDPSFLKRLVAVPGQRRATFPPLTPREDDVLQQLAAGRDVRSIARELDISANTCRGYVRGVLAKLGAHSQLEAVAVARRHGLIHRETSS